MKRTIVYILIMLISTTIIIAKNKLTCDEKVTLSGKLITELYYGPPGFGEDPQHDPKVYPYILDVKEPVAVKCDDEFGGDIDNISKFQVVFNEAQLQLVKEKFLKGKQVQLVGALFFRDNANHYTEVLIDAEKIIELETDDPIEKSIIEGKQISIDLNDVDIDQIKIYRNMVFAKYGRKFTNTSLNNIFYFSNRYPFKINNSYSDTLLTQIDKKNIEILSKYEQLKGSTIILDKINLPAQVKDFEALYGFNYTIEYPDEDDPSPWGQTIRWSNINNNFSLSVLADGDQEYDPNSSVSIYCVKAIPNKIFKINNSLILNKSTLNEIRLEFNHYGLKESNFADLKIEVNTMWIYFKFENNVLVEVVQATFDIDIAD